MPLWIPITIAAAFLQNLRSLLQKRLTGKLSTGGATFARFVFAFPLALAYALIVSGLTGWFPASFSLTFCTFLVMGALAQILATYALLASFGHGAFAIGTAYSKTEAVQAALVAAFLLGELLSLWGWLAVFIGMAGVALMAFKRREDGLAALNLSDRAVLWGLLAGALFAFASVGYRGASLSLGDGSVFARAGWTPCRGDGFADGGDGGLSALARGGTDFQNPGSLALRAGWSRWWACPLPLAGSPR